VSAPPIPRPTGGISVALARNRLGAFAIGSSIASSVAPLTVTALVISSALAVTGLAGVPVAMLAGGGLLLLFSVGYLAMARRIPNAGAFYAYVAQGIGRPIGIGTSWLALATYCSFQLCCYGGFGALVSPLVDKVLPYDLPWWVLAGAVWIVVTILGANEVTMSEKVMVVLVVAETILVSLYTLAVTFGPGFHFSGAALHLNVLWAPTAGVLVVIAMTSFAGVEQSAVYSEEAKDRVRTIPIATYATIAVVMTVYFFTSWTQVSAGGSNIIDDAGKQGQDLFFNQAAVVLGHAAIDVGRVALGTSLVAALLAFQNAVARYAFALGREGVLFRWLGHTTIKGAPRKASLAQSAVAALVLILFAVTGWDPLLQLFYLGSTTGGLGVLLLVTLTSIAVIAFFARDKHDENVWRRLIAPGIATVLLLIVSYLALDNLDTLYDVDPGTGPALIVPLLFLALFVAGTVWGLILKATRPEVYAGIGLGTRSTA
jgi:amino acid transporter